VGVFDLRCGVTRISTLWDPPGGRRTVSMFLLERRADGWAPWTPPVRGCYDRYGGIELWPEDATPEVAWVGDRLSALWEGGALVSDFESDLLGAHHRGRSRVELLLHHGAETAYNGAKLTIDGRSVAACVVLDLAAAAIADADPAPPATLADALAAWFPEGGAGRAHFADAPAGLLPQLARYASVRAYMATRGGFAPVRPADARQHDDAAVRRSVHAAWTREDGPVRRMIAAAAPAWAARWRGAPRTAARPAPPPLPDLRHAFVLPYAPTDSFNAGDVLDHPSFGRGLVDALIEPNKLRVRFADAVRTLVHRLPPRT
jgi:hypothetical protein